MKGYDMSKIVVLTDLAAQKELESCDVIPSSRFLSFTEMMDDPAKRLEAGNVFLWPYSPGIEELPSNKESERNHTFNSLQKLLGIPLDMGEQVAEEHLAALLSSVLVHLVFVGEPTDADSHNKTSVNTIGKVRRWYEIFNNQLKRRFQLDHSEQFTSVLVLVTLSDIEPTEEDVKELNALGEREGIFSLCYFMGNRSLGVSDGDVFHSENIWPVLVGRLLLSFLIRDVKQLTRGVRIWRAFELLGEFEPELIEKQLRGKLGEAYQRIIENQQDIQDVAWKEVYVPSEKVPEKQEPLDLPALSPDYVSWLDFDAEQEVTEVAKPERWREVIRNRGEEFIARINKKLFGDESGSPINFKKLFTTTHLHPAYVYAAQRMLVHNMEKIDDLKSAQHKTLAKWDRVVAKELERQNWLKLSRECAQELTATQNHFLRPIWGVFLLTAVSLACGVMFSRFLVAIRPNAYSMPAAVLLGGGAFLGALIIWLFLGWLQIKRGKSGAIVIHNLCEQSDKAMRDRDWHTRETITHAEAVWYRMRHQATAFRIKLLLERIQRILHEEIQQKAVATQEVKEEESLLETQADRKKTVQKRFKERTVLKKAYEISDALEMGFIFDEIIDRFFPKDMNDVNSDSLTALWVKLCEAQDVNSSGNFPARIFIPSLRKFMLKFIEMIEVEIRKRLFLKRDFQLQIQMWIGETVKGIKYQELYFSSILKFTQQREDEVNKFLFVRPDCSPGLDAGRQAHEAAILNDLSQVAFLFEEVQVRLGRNETTGFLGLEAAK